MKISKINGLILILSIAVMGMGSAVYRQYTAEQRAEAVGDVKKLSKREKVIYTDLNDGTFQAKSKPNGTDWLAQHEEPGQTFVQYLMNKPNLPSVLGGITTK